MIILQNYKNIFYDLKPTYLWLALTKCSDLLFGYYLLKTLHKNQQMHQSYDESTLVLLTQNHYGQI